MDCGVPFCQEGCPLGNKIPDWNDLVYSDRWREALTHLHATNNFPEFTGLICPAPCESACVLDINDDAVTIEQIELAIVTRGFDEGWIVADPPDHAHRAHRRRDRLRPGRAGGGRRAQPPRPLGHRLRARRGARRPAALRRARRQAREVDHRPARGAARRGGHRVRVRRRRRPRPAGRRSCARATTRSSSRSGRGSIATSRCPGRELRGVHFAMEYLYQRNRHVARQQGRSAPEPAPDERISAAGRRVVVVGGGDTGMDCISNALREGASDVLLLDVYPPLPADGRPPGTPWPLPPKRTHLDLRARRGRRAPLRHRDHRDRGRGRARQGRRGPPRRGHLVARPARRCRAASSPSPPTWC